MMIVKTLGVIIGVVLVSSIFSDKALAQHTINGHTFRFSPQEAQQAAKFVNNIPGLHLAKDIPSNFPIPAYTSNVVRKSFVNSTVKGPPAAGVNIVTKDQPKVVYDWYLDVCKQNKWLVKTPTAQLMQKMGKAGQFYMLDAEKERDQLSVFCVADPESRGTMISINYSMKRK